jgi:hypothetical protein
LISIVEAAADRAAELRLERVGLFGTAFTMQADFYPAVFARRRITVVTPAAPDQEYIHDKYMNELVNAVFSPETRARIIEIARRLAASESLDAIVRRRHRAPASPRRWRRRRRAVARHHAHPRRPRGRTSMERMSARVLLLAAAVLSFRCATTSGPAAVVNRYLAVTTLEEASAMLAPEYRLWFGERKGDGLDREAAIAMLTWDYALHPRHRVESLTVRGDEVIARVHEDNDFSLLIGFPGWDATSTYTIDATGRIASQLYVPKPGQPEWRPYLDALLAWIREHRPDVLPRIFPDGRLARSAEAAQEWVRVLREWRAVTGQPDPTR